MKPSSTYTFTIRVAYFLALTLLFACLKLSGYIDWPWIWVLSPLWIPLLILVIVAVILYIGYRIYVAKNKRSPF